MFFPTIRLAKGYDMSVQALFGDRNSTLNSSQIDPSQTLRTAMMPSHPSMGDVKSQKLQQDGEEA